MSLNGKVAIITGSTSGIGQAVAKAMAAQGCKVLIHGLERAQGTKIVQSIVRSGGTATLVIADLSRQSTPGRLVRHAIDRWGRLDVVINNAARFCNRPVDQLRNREWEATLRVNLLAPFFVVQAALPHLRRTKGNVVFISSINGWRNQPNNLVYDTTKAALNHLTTGLALDLKGDGVRFNALAVGGTDTPALFAWNRQFMSGPVEIRKKIARNRRKGLLATPENIADAVVFLTGAQASWINGAVIPVDKGNRLV